MEESKKARRHPQQTFKMFQHSQPFQFSTIAHCINCSLIPFITHTLLNHICTFTSLISHSLNFSHLPKLSITLALPWIVTLLIIHVLLTFTPFISHVHTNHNNQQYASHMCLPYSLHRPSPSGYSLYIPNPHYFTHMSPICCTLPSHVCIPLFLVSVHPTPLYPSGPLPHQQHWNPMFLCQLLHEPSQHLHYGVQPVNLEDRLDNVGKIKQDMLSGVLQSKSGSAADEKV